MANPSLVVRIAANLQELRANLAEGRQQIETTAASMNRMANAYNGDRTIREAHAVAAAIQSIGGVSNLTEREQARVNRTVEEAIAKYQALGREAPAHLRQLAQETSGAVEKTSLLTRGVQGLIAAVSVRAVAGMAGDVLDLTGKLSDLAGKSGIGTEALQRLAFVTSQSGVSLEQVATGAVRMGRSLVEGEDGAVNAVKALGLNVQALIAAGPEQAFLQIGEAIARVPNPMEQAALATALFGKSGADYLPAFSANMSDVAAQAQRSGAILSADLVAAGDAAGDAMGRLKAVGLAIFAQVFLPLVPAIEAAANWLGQALPAALQAARDGVDWLIRQGMRLNVWLLDLAVSVAQTVRDVPVLGRVFGESSADIDRMRQYAQGARDQLNAFVAQGVQPTAQAVQAAAPLVTTFAQAHEHVARAGRQAGQVISNEFIGPLQAEQVLVTRSIQDTASLTRQLEAWARTNGAVLAPSIQQVNAALTAQEPLVNTMQATWAQFAPTVQANVSSAGGGITGFFNQVFGGASGLGQNISNIFSAAFTGGGGALGAVQSFATQTLSALMGMIPGLGPFLSGFAGPIVAMFSRLANTIGGFFRDLFGGPSRDELNGRNLVNEFENNLIGLLSDTGRAEAGTERWRQVVVSLREEYVAHGLTAEQALEDARRLWESSRQGADATRRVIAEIEANLNRTASSAVDSVNRIGAAIDGLPDTVDFTIRGHYQAPDDRRGYANGTLGVHGSWFRDFGPATATVLHGHEAVVTPQQAPAFAQAVLGGGDAELKRLVRDLPKALKLAMREAMVMG